MQRFVAVSCVILCMFPLVAGGAVHAATVTVMVMHAAFVQPARMAGLLSCCEACNNRRLVGNQGTCGYDVAAMWVVAVVQLLCERQTRAILACPARFFRTMQHVLRFILLLLSVAVCGVGQAAGWARRQDARHSSWCLGSGEV